MIVFVRIVLVLQHLILCKVHKKWFADRFVSQFPAGFMEQACFAYETIAIKEGLLMLPDIRLSGEAADDITSY